MAPVLQGKKKNTLRYGHHFYISNWKEKIKGAE
jgi:hypothetical protein